MTVPSQLRRTALFSSLSAAEAEALVRAGQLRRLSRGEALAREGAPGTLTFLVTGRLAIQRLDEAGRLSTLRLLEPGALVGLSTALGAPHSADLVAQAASTVLTWPAEVAREAVLRHPAVARQAVLELGALVAELTDQLVSSRSDDVEARSWRAVQRLGKGRRELALSHAQLAELVGASRANVSRALARLEARGLLTRRRGRLLL